MALEDIKKAIDEQTQTEIAQIDQEGNKKVAEVQAAWNKKIADKRQAIIASAQRKANQKIQQTEFKMQSQNQTEVLNQKKQILERVYKNALQKLTSLDDNQYVELVANLIAKIPETEGSLISVKDKEALLKKALKKSGKKFDILDETIGGHGGFIFRSEKVEIDQTFATLVENSKEDTLLEVSSKLFNREQE